MIGAGSLLAKLVYGSVTGNGSTPIEAREEDFEYLELRVANEKVPTKESKNYSNVHQESTDQVLWSVE
jgi:hypothetical protein